MINLLTPVSTSAKSANLHLAFDVGHSSIGWAVLHSAPELLGCGVVTFPTNDCLASQRRAFRRQRRHIRATRQRISRLERLLEHLGVMSKDQLQSKHTAGGGHSAPWLLAARVLRGGKLLTWSELWDVLRWYAHNRGYDGNKSWSAQENEAKNEDTDKVKNAQGLYARYNTSNMAETFCAVSGLDPLGKKISCNLPGDKRPKALNAAFPREDVESEVQQVLKAHLGKLPSVDPSFIAALMSDWKALPCPEIGLPGRYRGGLLFGQLIPRFENRIIATCPVTYERVYQEVLAESGDNAKAKHEAKKLAKAPNKDCPEFFRFRWAMQVANIQVATGTDRSTRSLTAAERCCLDKVMKAKGAFTPGEFKKAVREVTGGARDNVEQMLTHPDADKALILDPALKAIESNKVWKAIFPKLPEALQKRALGQLRRGKRVGLADLLAHASSAMPEVEALISGLVASANTKTKAGQPAATRETLLPEAIRVEPLSGRAPYSRAVMREAADYVFTTDHHPAEECGPLYRNEAIRNAQIQRAIDEQTNNHLVRHRLLILERLHRDIIKEYAAGDSSRIERVTIEVNRDLKELSGKTAKQVAQDLGQRLANFKSVSSRLEKAFAGKNVRITPGLIRKARIAEDLGWKCPYTGKSYDEFDLLHRKVDKDHIIPRSERASDSLDSLVITFAEVNKMKGKRTALRFIEDCQGQTVEGKPELSLKTVSNYLKDASALETFKGHEDDQRRKKRRKEMLEIRDYVEKEFTPGDLTKTSQLVRLGAQLLERAYAAQPKKPVITSLPGSVTGTVRKSWSLLGCLSGANPQIIDSQTNEVRTKTEIRGITHLHHALDACVLAFTSMFFPRDGGVWELMVKRRLNESERNILKQRLRSYVEFAQEGQPKLIDLPVPLKNQIRQRLAERRVVQHIPAERTGLRVEQNAWRVLSIKDGEATLRQSMRQPDGKRVTKETTEKLGKLLGLHPGGGIGKLQQNKSALVIPDNFGLALDPEPQILPFHKVPVRLRELREKNGGRPVRVLRNGMLIQVPRGKFEGVWKVFSLKNNATGIAVDIGRPDVVRLQNKTEGHKINVLLTTLLKDGLAIQRTPLVGAKSSQ